MLSWKGSNVVHSSHSSRHVLLPLVNVITDAFYLSTYSNKAKNKIYMC